MNSSIWGYAKKVQSAAVGFGTKALSDLDKVLADDVDEGAKLDAYGKEIISEEEVYKKLLDDAQFQIVEMTREYQGMVSERDAKIKELESKVGGGVSAPSPKSTEVRSPHDVSKDDYDAMVFKTKDWEERMRVLLSEKSKNTATLTRANEAVARLSEENSILKNKISAHSEVVDKLADRDVQIDATMDDLVGQISRLNSEKADHDAANDLLIAKLNREKSEMAEKISAHERTILKLLAQAPGEGADEEVVEFVKPTAPSATTPSSNPNADKEIEKLKKELDQAKETIEKLKVSSVVGPTSTSSNVVNTAELDKLKKELEASQSNLKSLQTSSSERASKLEKDLQSTTDALKNVEQLRGDLEKQLNDSKNIASSSASDSSKMVEKIRSETQKEIQNIKESLEGQNKKDKSEAESKIALLIKDKDEAIKKIEVDHKAKVDDLIKKLSGDSSSQLVTLKEESAKEIAKLTENNNKEIQKVTKEMENLIEKIKDLEKDKEEKLKQLEKFRAEASASLDEAKKSAEAAKQKALSEAQESASSSIANQVAQVKKAAADELSDKLNKLSSEKNQEKDALISKHNSDIKNIEDKYQNEKAAILKDKEVEITKLTKEKDSDKEQSMRALTTEKDAALSKLSKDRDEAIAKITKEARESEENALKAMEEKKNSEKVAALAQLDSNLKAAAAKESAEISAKLNGIIANNEKKLVEAANAKEALIASHNQAVEKLNADYTSKMAKIQTDANAQIDKIKSEQKAVIDRECAKIKEEMQKVVDEYNELYKNEAIKRKAIHNQLIEIQGNIRVYCRVRPIVRQEIESGEAADVTEFPVDGDIVIRKDDSSKNRFEFDHVFNPSSTQEQVFDQVIPFVGSVVDGYNVCIFAYGQTGSGKTFTMEGPPENRGVNFRAITELFKLIAERSKDYDFKIEVGLNEVYNEKVRDLQVEKDSGDLDIKLNKAGGTYIDGLTWTEVKSPEEITLVLSNSSKNRAVGSHNMNEHSSRSHLVMCIIVRTTNKHSGGKGRGKLYLIDLAGSERVGKTDATGQRLEEAKNINRSLSALGDVIAALGSDSKHIPYRNSKLTYLLQDSLSGDSKVLMFVNVSPVTYNVSETLCSLKFAERCRNVALGKAKKNEENPELVRLRKQVEELTAKADSDGPSPAKTMRPSPARSSPAPKE